jgi:predicted nucleic acid-binding protein
VIVLADTSAWVDLWRHGNARLAALLAQNQVVVHPFVLGEIALGRITPRGEVLRRLAKLRAPRVAQHGEVLTLIERASLWGRGIGWVDAHLLASALLDRLRLLTIDRRLAQAAQVLGVGL